MRYFVNSKTLQYFRNEEKLAALNATLLDTQQSLADKEEDLKQLHEKELEFLGFSKEMTEKVVELQNEICLVKAKVGIKHIVIYLHLAIDRVFWRLNTHAIVI